MDHTHCASCFSSYCSQQSFCSVDYCPNGCGFSMHQCKLNEHDRYTCPEAITPCVNANYGCDDLLKRKHITAHIEHCPASTVFCSFSHERSEVFVTKSIETRSSGGATIKPDDNITAHIEHSSAGTVVCSYSYERSEMSTTDPVEDKPSGAQPTEEERDGKRKLLIDEKFLRGDLNVRVMKTDGAGKDSGNEVASWYSGSYPYLTQHLSTGSVETTSLSPNLSVDMNMGFLTNYGSSQMRKFKTKLLAEQKRICIDTTVSTKLNYLKGAGQRKHCCSFPCNSIVRRDEFSAHWKSLHLDIQLDIQQLVHRCPMYTYGCQYGVLNLTPNPEGSSLDYSRETDCFLYKMPPVEIKGIDEVQFTDSAYTARIQAKQELAMYGYEDDEDESYDVLGQLPAEVLMTICGFLDSQSLWQLSQVNHYLRKVCLNLVKKIGMVYSEWERDSSGSWTQGPKIWSYSKVFRGIPSWRYTEAPTVAAHMMSCDFLKANVKQYTSDMVLSMVK